MIDLCVELLHLFHGERVGLCSDLLRAVVLILAIDVLEEHRLAAEPCAHVNACIAHLFNHMHLIGSELGGQLKRHLVGEVTEGVSKIE